MNQIKVDEVLCFFDKHGDALTISKKIPKDWYPIDSENSAFQLGLHSIEHKQLNKLNISFQDESRLQCVVLTMIFHMLENILFCCILRSI